VKPYNFLLAVLLAVTTAARGQEAKLHLRDFTPRYMIDTLLVKGEPSPLKRLVIKLLQVRGIKSAYLEEGSGLLTVQYNDNLIQLASIRAYFEHKNSLETKREHTQKVPKGILLICCIPYSFHTKTH
jgi:hypothetical protein